MGNSAYIQVIARFSEVNAHRGYCWEQHIFVRLTLRDLPPSIHDPHVVDNVNVAFGDAEWT